MKIKQMKIPSLYPIWIVVYLMPLFIALLFIFGSSAQFQFELLSLAAIIYMVVALLHHHREKTLSFEIIVEYLLVALLCLVIVLSQSFLF